MDKKEVILIEKLRAGDEDTYIWLFKQYYSPLCIYAKGFLRRNDLAEEIVSETFFNIWRNRSRLKIKVSLKLYIYQAVCNNSLSYLRKMQREDKLDDRFGNFDWDFGLKESQISQKPLEYLINKDLENSIKTALGKLTQQQQTVFKLKRYEGKKNREIGKILGISEKTVEMHLRNGSLKMKELLKDHFDDLIILLLFLFQ